jgi:chromate reductase, NAD(P)H dehydrogenase (quinone)
MIYILSGTNRRGSRTRQVAEQVLQKFKKHTKDVEIIDLTDLPFQELNDSHYGGRNLPTVIGAAVEKINKSEGLVVITPEYNGSMPGVLKFFIDHWSYPTSFEFRPIAFVGLGMRWGGMRPVEHLQQIFNYRNAFIYPERVFINNIDTALKDGVLGDQMVNELLDKQANGFVRFIAGLKEQKLFPRA